MSEWGEWIWVGPGKAKKPPQGCLETILVMASYKHSVVMTGGYVVLGQS